MKSILKKKSYLDTVKTFFVKVNSMLIKTG